jgi:hypothetical protein
MVTQGNYSGVNHQRCDFVERPFAKGRKEKGD